MVSGLRPERKALQISTGRVTSKRVEQEGDDELVPGQGEGEEEGGDQGRRQHRRGDVQEHPRLGGAEVAGGALDPR